MDTSAGDIHLRPWQSLSGVDDAEVWIANTNLELNYFLENDTNAGHAHGQGICLELELGGEIFVHTTSEGMIVLDVTQDAGWSLPVLMACGATQSGRGQFWVLGENSMVQLLLGLNSLIRAYRLMLQHDFGSAFRGTW